MQIINQSPRSALSARRIGLVLLAGAIVSMSWRVPAAFAFDNESPSKAAASPEVPPVTGAGLADQEDAVRERVNRLEDRLFELSKVIRKTEPEKAAKLLQALGASRSLQIRQKIDAIVEKLRSDRLSDALDSQKVVEDDLRELLRLLLEEPNKLDERKKEIERAAQLRQELNKIIEDQRREKAASEEAAQEVARAKKLEAAAAKARELLDRQIKASKEPGQTDGKSPAETQGEIRSETEQLARDMSDASGSPSSESGGSSSNGSTTGDAQEAKGALDRAAQAMKSAEDKLGAGDQAGATGDQTAAADELRKAVENLEHEAAELRHKLQLDKQEAEQRATAEQTRKLSREMNPAGQPGDDKSGGKEGQGDSKKSDKGGQEGGDSQSDEGSQQGGDQGSKSGDKGDQPSKSPSQPDGPPPPGHEDVEGAVPLQEDAADKLKEENPEDAAKKQEEALKKLEQAKEELEQVLEQLRREQQEELLAALESRFRTMLAMQLECNKATDRLAALGAAEWKRTDQLQLAEIAEKQRGVGKEADKALAVMVDEGSTVVFPQVLEQVRDDAGEVGGRVAGADVGEHTREMQAELASTIRELLDSVKQMQKDNESGEGGGGGGENSPLLPGSAELKLLRSCQMRINDATRSLSADRYYPDIAVQEIQSRIEKLEQRQAQVAKMAREMNEALTKAQ